MVIILVCTPESELESEANSECGLTDMIIALDLT